METMIALGGNPNSGKTTLFNTLTGARQHVGNYPGVTVEKKEGVCRIDGTQFNIVDLPGIYSLSAYSMEEVVARDFLIQQKPRLIINIVDASNLERNLYLTLQFMEMGIPVCIALNMMDVAHQRGITIDAQKLSTLLGVPVIPTVARSGSGKKALMRRAAEMVAQHDGYATGPNISYGEEVDTLLDKMTAIIAERQFLAASYPARWVALKYLENDAQLMAMGEAADAQLSFQLEQMVSNLAGHLRKTLIASPEEIIADYRYGYIRSMLAQGVIRYSGDRSRLFFSDKIDKVLVHRLAGPVIMLAVLLGLYQFTFTYSALPVGWLDSFFGWLNSSRYVSMFFNHRWPSFWNFRLPF